VCTGKENSKLIWNKFIIRKDIIETSQVVLNFCQTVYYNLHDAISDNIQLSIIFDQRQYTIIYNIQSATIYDYLQYMISDNIG
jgi:hypothetical protein